MELFLLRVIAIFCVTVASFASGQNCGFRAIEGPTTTTTTTTTPTPRESPTEGTTFWPRPHDGGADRPRHQRAGEPTHSEDGQAIGDFYIRETQSTLIPFAVIETYNMVWAHVRSTYYRVEIEDDKASFYVTPHFREYIDNFRDSIMQVIVLARCTDGTLEDYFYTYIEDENTRAPQFNPSSLSLAVPQPWPVEIPINLQRPILVRDMDYWLSNARMTLTASLDIVNPVLSPLFSGDFSPLGFEYKVELFLRTGVDAGHYNVQLTASDGLYVIPYYMTINVTDVVCKGQKSDPVFGQKPATGAGPKILYYNATLDSLPEEGDALPGVLVQAFNPDDECSVELSVNSEHLSVSGASGRVSFTKALTLVELEALGRTWIVEIIATEPESGKSATVPLIITNDFEAIHANM